MNLTIKNDVVSNTVDENNDTIIIPENCKTDLIKAMKIGYYKEFYKQGLITAEQLELLIAMQDKTVTSAA